MIIKQNAYLYSSARISRQIVFARLFSKSQYIRMIRWVIMCVLLLYNSKAQPCDSLSDKDYFLSLIYDFQYHKKEFLINIVNSSESKNDSLIYFLINNIASSDYYCEWKIPDHLITKYVKAYYPYCHLKRECDDYGLHQAIMLDARFDRGISYRLAAFEVVNAIVIAIVNGIDSVRNDNFIRKNIGHLGYADCNTNSFLLVDTIKQEVLYDLKIEKNRYDSLDIDSVDFSLYRINQSEVQYLQQVYIDWFMNKIKINIGKQKYLSNPLARSKYLRLRVSEACEIVEMKYKMK